MIVVDASVVSYALAVEPTGGPVRQRLRNAVAVHAPELVDLEVASTVRGLTLGGVIDVEHAELAVTDLRELPVFRHPHTPLLERIWALRHNLTPYDAVYVALAERLGLALLSGDTAHRDAPGVACAVEIIDDVAN